MNIDQGHRLNPRIGWIGTGVMGASMCGHLIDAGYEVVLTTRSREKAETLLQRGASWADTPQEVADRSDLVFAIVGYPSDVRDVFLHPDHGVVAGARPGSVWIDMTTSEPSLAIEIAEAAAKAGAAALDAPVSGGDRGAREGTLSIMVGGDAATLDRAMPCLQTFGKTIVHQGPAGSGQHTKMVNQTLIASGMIGVCEALIYAHRAGLDLPTVLQSVSSGAAGSWSLSNLAPRIIEGDFEPGFYVEHFVKDMGIALAESRRMNLCLPGLALAEQLYQSVIAKGGGRLGTQALMRALADMSAVEFNDPHELVSWVN
ncbi:NAD(P)-dependent oxidoreductase [Neorhodopirellula pilleata]|uniref:2-hydroxy-3-oxopropionate reductase n=1 Tax=Neorhodopirellula pilleata TaxID=2714738 RepID=A0A5C6AYA7_9BACT|nr:NAD(P)-dependent oxidoreductase [Neorhodopirellula pilleata]TWU04092.1 2-hydroxy-3-oxopropionate reductase [Neorhodopirellula pilleata]